MVLVVLSESKMTDNHDLTLPAREWGTGANLSSITQTLQVMS